MNKHTEHEIKEVTAVFIKVVGFPVAIGVGTILSAFHIHHGFAHKGYEEMCKGLDKWRDK